MTDEWVTLEASVEGGPWEHIKSVPAWAMADRETAADQRHHVRSLAREWAGVGSSTRVLVRVVDDNGAVLS